MLIENSAETRHIFEAAGFCTLERQCFKISGATLLFSGGIWRSQVIFRRNPATWACGFNI
jgi:hypothetical protein